MANVHHLGKSHIPTKTIIVPQSNPKLPFTMIPATAW